MILKNWQNFIIASIKGIPRERILAEWLSAINFALIHRRHEMASLLLNRLTFQEIDLLIDHLSNIRTSDEPLRSNIEELRQSGFTDLSRLLQAVYDRNHMVVA